MDAEQLARSNMQRQMQYEEYVRNIQVSYVEHQRKQQYDSIYFPTGGNPNIEETEISGNSYVDDYVDDYFE